MSPTEPSTKSPKSRRSLIALAIAVPAIVGAFAVPSMMGADDEPVEALQRPAEALPPVVETDVAIDAELQPEPVPEPETPADDGIAPFAGGDLVLGVSMRWDKFPEGSAIRAHVTLRNLSLETVHVPAPGEPQPTLTLVVVDTEDREVRRIVEETADALPRHTVALLPGATVRFPLDIIAPGETGLLPGSYRVAASYDTHASWHRTGLPVWTAPAGSVRSDLFSFDVTPAKE